MKRPFLFFAAATLVACGPPTRDKTDPNGTPNGSTNSTVNGATNAASNGMPNGATNSTTSTNNQNGDTNSQTTPNNTTNGNTNNQTTSSNNTTNGTTNGGTNNTNNTPGCTLDPTFTGQIGGTDDHDGGSVMAGALTVDAGLSGVVAGAPLTPDDPTTPAVDEGTADLTPPVSVDGAIVTATAFGPEGNRRFWIEDANETIQMYLDVSPPVTVRVGMEVSFMARQVQNFEGHLQITSITSFAVLSEDNGVPVRDVNNRALGSDDYGHVVRLAGRLVGPPVDCGGTDCWDFEYPGGTAVFRSKSLIIEDGSCVSFVGPLYSYPGPQQGAMASEVQLDTINFDWMFVDIP